MAIDKPSSLRTNMRTQEFPHPLFPAEGTLRYIVQTGNHCQNVFCDNADARFYTNLLADSAPRWHVRVHGFLLLPRSIQLLASPLADGDLSGMMQHVNGQHSKHLNRRYRNSQLQLMAARPLEDWEITHYWGGIPFNPKLTGHNWQRPSTKIAVEPRHFAPLLAFIENTPVRIGQAEAASDWAWSSVHAHLANPTPGATTSTAASPAYNLPNQAEPTTSEPTDLTWFHTLVESRFWQDYLQSDQVKQFPKTFAAASASA